MIIKGFQDSEHNRDGTSMSLLMTVLAGYKIVLMMTGITPLNIRLGKGSNSSGCGWKRMRFMTIITTRNRISFLRIVRHESVRGDLLSARCYIFGTRCREFVERSMTIQTNLFGDCRCRCGAFRYCGWGSSSRTSRYLTGFKYDHCRHEKQKQAFRQGFKLFFHDYFTPK